MLSYWENWPGHFLNLLGSEYMTPLGRQALEQEKMSVQARKKSKRGEGSSQEGGQGSASQPYLSCAVVR